jgi:vacuolar-type H+-ATPase subunit F/Vma7
VNKQIYAIGSKMFVLGFRGAGCKPIICNKPKDALAHLKEGICILEPSLAKPITAEIEKLNREDSEVTIIVYGTDSLMRSIEKATGIVLK